jgi:hypothetical protein
MSARTLKRLAAALAALVVIWLGLSLARRARRDTEGRLPAARFDPKAVDQALIVKGTDTLRFVKRGDGWYVNALPADASLVSELVSALTDTAAPSELVAQNASSHRQLGLDSSDARRVSVLEGGRTLAALLVGNRGGSYGTVYVRRPGKTAAYQLGGQLAALVDRPLDGWRNRTIAKLAPDSVAEVQVRRRKREYTLMRDDSGWRLGNGAADSSAVAGLLGRFRDLEAAGFATAAQADSARFAPPARTVQLLAQGGRPLLVLSMDSTATGFWVRRSGDSTTYRLDNWTANGVSPADSTLRKKPPRSAAAAAPVRHGR